jgi:hypothetical protein
VVPAFAVAAAGVISTVVFGSLALAQQAELDELCPDPSRCHAGTADEADKLKRYAVAADVSLAVAVAGAGVGLYAWFATGDSSSKSASFGFAGSF